MDSGKKVDIVSYEDKAEQLLSQNGCSVSDSELSGVALHECDAVPGASGSPILQGGKVVGVHIGFASPANKNLAQLIEAEQPLSAEQLSQLPGIQLTKEIDCDTDCGRACRVCVRWVGCRTEPVCKASCDITKAMACDALKNLKNAIVSESTTVIEKTTPRSQWTYSDCTGPFMIIVSGITGAAIEAKCGGSSGGVCGGLGGVAGAALNYLICKQLCVDRHITSGCPE